MCAALLLVLLWGGMALHLAFDKAQTTYQASLNVANLSQVVDEHLTRRVYEIDRLLYAAKQEFERHPGSAGVIAWPTPNLGPDAVTAAVEFVDATGRPLATGGPSDGTSRAFWGTSDAFAGQRQARDDRLVIGKPVLMTHHGAQHWRIPLSRRLDRADGAFAGIVAITVDPEFLSAAFDKVNIGRGGFIAVIGRDDFVIRACSTEAGVIVPSLDLKGGPLPVALAQASAGAFADTSPVDGTPRIVGYRALGAYPLVVAIGASKAEILGSYWARRTWLIIVGALISVVVLCVAAQLLRQNARQQHATAALARQAEELRISRRQAQLANAAAQAADRAKSAFLANMSHELRTPLNAIIGFSEVMSTALFGPVTDRYQDYAQSIHAAGSHLLKILNDILDLSKIEAGRLELHEEPVTVDELFEGCRRIVAERAAAAGLSLEFETADIVLHADPLRVKQMVLNLLSNAIKFTPAGGRVTAIADLTDDNGVVIGVRDTGIGIKAEDVPNALEPFGQVNNTATRAQEGTGLGLPLVRRLAELHGGEMTLDSIPGQGTTVTLSFPPARTLQPRGIGAEAS